MYHLIGANSLWVCFLIKLHRFAYIFHLCNYCNMQLETSFLVLFVWSTIIPLLRQVEVSAEECGFQWSSLLFCSDGGMGHGILSFGAEGGRDERRWRRRRRGRKLLDRGSFCRDLRTTERHYGDKKQSPSLTFSLFFHHMTASRILSSREHLSGSGVWRAAET